MKTLVANIIYYFHLALMLSGFIIPFSSDIFKLRAYSLVIPFLLLHWSMNDDTCAFTVIEQYLRGEQDKHKTFIGRVMKGVYILPDEDWSKILKMAYFSLWVLVQWRLNQLY